MSVLRSLKFLFVMTASLTCCCVTGQADEHFQQKVAPILQRRCLSCHNEAQHKGDFSLQTASQALAEGYIVAGEPAASHLLTVITPQQGKAAMPQGADPLSRQEIEWITDWIASGAKWPEGFVLEELQVSDFDWWSYRPLQRPAVPVSLRQWGKTPIDAFIERQLNKRGLSPAPPADRRTLLRRVTFDLTGLPPTPEETAAFVNDSDPQAYEKLVDRLLASPHYGERWGQHWLDIVKYADTCGYDKDKLRPNAWPYRDYVIRSFNNDKPYTRFVQEQIAGDALFPGEPEGILGLGFLAAGPWDFIGHVEVSETKTDGLVARNLDRDDMVSSTINTFCSLTVQCARCHHHKFDPITQQQYYGLQAIFAAVDRAERAYDLDPEIERKRQQLQENIQSTSAELTQLKKERETDGGPRFKELIQEISKLEAQQKVQQAAEFGYHSAIVAAAETSQWVQIELPNSSEVSRIVLRPCYDDYAGIGAGFGFPVRFRVEVADPAGEWKVVREETDRDFPNPGLTAYEIPLNRQQVQQIRITATKLAERKGDYHFALGELQVFGVDEQSENNLAGEATVTALNSIEAPVRWGRQNLTDGKWASGGDPQLARQLAELQREFTAILARIDTPERVLLQGELEKSLAESKQQLAELPAGSLVYAAATEFKAQGNFQPTKGKPRNVHVLHRGEVQQPGAVAVPAVLPLSEQSDWQLDLQLSEAQRRAKLALWLTAPEHPLLWRSIVNRIWQYHFDSGLVETPNDFGRMGALPTHPELLDWLACEFRDQGESFKKLHRLIVTSAVYQQSSAHHTAHAKIDAGNQYYWRMNRRRLTAEEIRDAILSVSGVLNSERGGPGYYLFELEKTAHSPHYEYHQFDPRDPASHRRSIYRFVVRSQPDPWMTTLDCADTSQSTPRRNETLTPLQALSLLNNNFNLVMAESFAQRLQQHSDSLPEQVEQAVQLLVQRPATTAERQIFVEYAEQHGLKNLCRFLFNLSEFVYLD